MRHLFTVVVCVCVCVCATVFKESVSVERCDNITWWGGVERQPHMECQGVEQ